MAGSDWVIVIDLKLPYDAFIHKGPVTTIRIPFNGEGPARRALQAMTIEVVEVHDDRRVIPGIVEDGDDDDSDQQH